MCVFMWVSALLPINSFVYDTPKNTKQNSHHMKPTKYKTYVQSCNKFDTLCLIQKDLTSNGQTVKKIERYIQVYKKIHIIWQQ